MNKQRKETTLGCVSALFRAVNHELRGEILGLLDEKGEMFVGHIYRSMRIEQSVASQHLKILHDSGLVTRTKRGRFVYYTNNPDMIGFVKNVATAWEAVYKK